MPNYLDTGEGATVGLSTTSTSACVVSITMPEFSVEAIDATCLTSTNFKEFIVTDLADPGEITVEYYWDAVASTLVRPGTTREEIITITWPIANSSNTTNATFIADGFVTSWKLPDFSIGDLQTASFTFKLNGADTEPAFTAESA